MPEYRVIAVYPYRFEIQVKVVSHTGYLWWRKEHVEWKFSNVDGDVFGTLFHFPKATHCDPVLIPKCEPFETKWGAEQKIAEFLGIKIVKSVKAN